MERITDPTWWCKGAFSHLHLNSTDQQRRQRAPSTPPRTPSSGASSDQAKFLSTALVPIGNDGQVDTAGRIQSDELELKLLRELIYSFQGIEGKIYFIAILFLITLDLGNSLLECFRRWSNGWKCYWDPNIFLFSTSICKLWGETFSKQSLGGHRSGYCSIAACELHYF